MGLRVFPADRRLHHHLITSCGCGAGEISQRVLVAAADPDAASNSKNLSCLLSDLTESVSKLMAAFFQRDFLKFFRSYVIPVHDSHIFPKLAHDVHFADHPLHEKRKI